MNLWEITAILKFFFLDLNKKKIKFKYKTLKADGPTLLVLA